MGGYEGLAKALGELVRRIVRLEGCAIESELGQRFRLRKRVTKDAWNWRALSSQRADRHAKSQRTYAHAYLGDLHH